MGQRHQIFIRTKNPLHINKKQFKETEEPKEKKRYNELKKELGGRKNTTLAFHHQWLFGLTAVGNALQVLDFNKKAGSHSNPFHEDYIEYRCSPYRDLRKAWIDPITYIMNIQTGELSEDAGRYGIEGSFYLNDEEPYMRERYDMGDNNDGCTIIDTVTGKYCFIAANGIEGKDCIPLYTPVSAVDYFKAYYPVYEEDEMPDGFAEHWYKKGYSLEELITEVPKRKKTLKKINKLFKDYEVLTLDEVKKMFPKVYKEVDEKEIGVVPER